MAGQQSRSAAEKAKWDAYYGGKPLVEESPQLRAFNDEFAAVVADLLPEGGRTLEAGSGDGWQSLALARNGKFDVALLDFSEEALNHARRRFAEEGVEAAFLLGDASEPGPEEFDLVFNAGVLEHFGFDEQVAMLKAMSSRSRQWVLAIVPNRRCYWYWIWRIQAAAGGDWPFGKEMPSSDLSGAFRAAGLQVMGQRLMGESWAEGFVSGIRGIDGDLLQDLLRIHRSPLLPAEQKGYLLAVLGRVASAPGGAPPPGWSEAPAPEGPREAELSGAIADALAEQIRMRRDLLDQKQGLARLGDLEKSLAAARREIEVLREASERDRVEIAAARAEQQRLNRELDRERATAAQMRASASWNLTAPLRWMAGLFARAKRPR
ncbi:MAG: hypothetical protein Fur0037_00760 [Planctomycetota bacterium]